MTTTTTTMSLNESSLEKKLSQVTNSQDSIQSLSLWLLHHKSHYKRITYIWFNCFEKSKSSHRLTLFYLANDVIQHAKRKGYSHFVDYFIDSLKKAIILCKDDNINTNIDRVFNIWLERSIYSESVIEEFRALLSGSSAHLAAISKIVAEFKLSELIDKIKKCKKCEQTCVSKTDALKGSKVDPTSGDVLNKLKDKTHGEQFTHEFDEYTKCLESAINALEKEVHIRNDLIENLEKSEVFYETQMDEAKTVVDAYKNFGLRVKNVWRKLDEMRPTLPSPLPSPPRDAPSPTNSDDGPTLPPTATIPTTSSSAAVDPFTAEVNSFLRRVANDHKSGHQTSSLDQRLSNLMHSISQGNDIQKTPHSTTHSNSNQIMQMSTNISTNMNTTPQISTSYTNNTNNWYQNQLNDQNISGFNNETYYQSHDTNINHSQSMYDYNYPHSMPDMNLMTQQNSTDIQPIQPLVSSRIQPVSTLTAPLMPSMPTFDYTSAENLEPADMDLGNSDDEDVSGGQRSQTQRTIKVIESRRNSNDMQLTDYNLPNNTNNNNYVNNNNHMTNSNNSVVPPYMPQYSPQLKSIARMPVRSTLNSVVQQPPSHPYPPPMQSPQQWRGPRSTVVPTHNFSPMSAPNHRNPHNWRSHNNNNTNNRNGNRKSRY
ncbi:homeobox protein 2-like [Oppia nitens]|uniref:homeobox protein 2-like n=1 Tax=Oppia nitens TaxID=1686743 RepID=UPI0023D9DBDE|nr:homeobox protein 2-like [Oppia nitens]